MTESRWRRASLYPTLTMVPLALALLMLAGACADPDSVSVPLKDCSKPGPGVAEACGGVLYDPNFQGTGARLFAYPMDFGMQPYRSSGGISPAPAQNIDDGRMNSGTFAPDHEASWMCRQLFAFGHGDWYLPAINELAAMLPGFLAGNPLKLQPPPRYVSSTEDGATTANYWMFDFGAGAQTSVPKPNVFQVRCIRREP